MPKKLTEEERKALLSQKLPPPDQIRRPRGNTPKESLAYASILVLLLAIVWQFSIAPRRRLWTHKEVSALNNEGCTKIAELKGCEDQYIDQVSGISYLACTDPDVRAKWLPPGALFDHSVLDNPASKNALYRFDTKTSKVTKLAIDGFDSHIYTTHGMDAWIDRSNPESPKVYLFIINHKPPADLVKVLETGADSVIELFETTLDSTSIRHLHTFRNESIVTPNDLVATSASSFYVTNDHRWKSHWFRKYEAWFDQPESGVSHCEKVGTETHCETAAIELRYPNGIAKGPGSTIYVTSSVMGLIWVFEEDASRYLLMQDKIKIGAALDNIKVMPSGEMIVTSIPSIHDFGERVGRPEVDRAPFLSPIEIYRVSNETTESKFYGTKYRVDKIFGDDGSQLSCATNAMVYKDKLYITSIIGQHLLVCPYKR